MKFVDLKKHIDENGACPIYLCEGEEAYFRDKAESLLKTRFLQDETLDYASFDGTTLKGSKLSSLVAAVNCFPFMSEKRLVRVTDFYPTEEEYEKYLKDLFENPPDYAILFILNSQKKTETGKATDKSKKANLQKKPSVTFVDCARSDEETIKKWIYLTCKRAGVYADGIVCGKICSYCVSNMSRIAMETEKLLTYLEAKGLTKLTDEIVDEIVYPDSEYKIYELSNAVSKRDYNGYQKIMKELSAKGYDEAALLATLCAHFKSLYEVSGIRGSDNEIAAALSMNAYAVKKNRELAGKFGRTRIAELYECVFSAISGFKCGELTQSSALRLVTAKIFF